MCRSVLIIIEQKVHTDLVQEYEVQIFEIS